MAKKANYPRRCSLRDLKIVERIQVKEERLEASMEWGGNDNGASHTRIHSFHTRAFLGVDRNGERESRFVDICRAARLLRFRR